MVLTAANCCANQPCKDFFTSHVLLSAESAVALSEYSQGSAEWFRERSMRITASEARSIPIKAHPQKWVERRLHPTFHGSTSTRYGQQNEPLARAWYQQSTSCEVAVCGLVVRPATSWLGASPDGLIKGSNKIVEIKCPAPQTLTKHGGLTGLFLSSKYDVRYQDDKLILSKTGKNRYYLQVQLQLYCCEKSLCDFVVWSPSEAHVVEVPFDADFVNSVVPTLESIYFMHLLPAIVDSRST